MKKITVNGYLCEGAFSFFLDAEKETIEGRLSINIFDEDISSIESDRYSIKHIEITGVSFGSEEDSIIYNFNASPDNLEVKEIVR